MQVKCGRGQNEQTAQAAGSTGRVAGMGTVGEGGVRW